jgi:ribosomal protein S27E
MPIDVRCEGCGRQLRVSDEHAGKSLRCPACNHISKAPSAPNHALLETIASSRAASPVRGSLQRASFRI